MEKKSGTTFKTRNIKLGAFLLYEHFRLIGTETDQNGWGTFEFLRDDNTPQAVRQFRDRTSLVEPHRYLGCLYELRGEANKARQIQTLRESHDAVSEETV